MFCKSIITVTGRRTHHVELLGTTGVPFDAWLLVWCEERTSGLKATGYTRLATARSIETS